VKPLFITFEGLDGSGKSTHLATAAGWLRRVGRTVVQTQEPGGSPLGEAIREVFLDPRWGGLDGTVEALLVFASRRQHLLEVIEPALASGATVLCDRFTDSTLAYQGFGRGVSLAVLEEADRLATGGRKPDRTILFDLPASAARARGQSHERLASDTIDRLDAEDLAFYERVRSGYLELAGREADRFRLVDSSGSRAETERQLRAALADLVASEEARR
jgi:dTMP kinase